MGSKQGATSLQALFGLPAAAAAAYIRVRARARTHTQSPEARATTTSLLFYNPTLARSLLPLPL
jgi:phosphotransferase system  glucose/maltose/N-acetylglucosamine-specific IIC component